MTFSLVTFRKMTFRKMAFSIKPFGIMTYSTTFGINDIQNSVTQHKRA